MTQPTSAYEHGRIVLAGIIPGRLDLWERAERHLAAEHFADHVLRTMWELLRRYHDATGAILTTTALDDILRQNCSDAGTVALYQETYALLADRVVDDASFLWSLEQVRDLAAHRATAETLTQAMEILTRGAQNDAGETLRGHAEARTHVLTQFAEIDHELARQAAPEGDMRDEEAEILAEIEAARQRYELGLPNGFEFGIPVWDDLIGGLQPGELDLLLGFASSGKTSLLVQLAWNTTVRQGKNVVIATTETLRPQVRRKVICRHSKLPMFGLPEGIDSHHLKHPHLLTPAEAAALPDVVADFTRNPAYGHFHIMQAAHGDTMTELEQRLMRVHRRWPVDFFGVDSFQLLRAARYRSSTREELASIVLEGKELAVTFDDGRGLCVASPWQVNRPGRDRAASQGHYDLLSVSETSEAERSADVIVSLLEPSDASSRYVDVLGQVLKDRDGPRTGSGTADIRVDYATSTFTSRNRQDGLSGLTATNGHSDDLHGLLMGR